MELTLNGSRRPIDDLIIAGWTGRNQAAVNAHIRELEALGVQPPATTPLYYRVSTSLLTTSDKIQVAGDESSGEVEPVLFSFDDGLWVGLGSDHTDRKVEAYDVTVSKQVCPKPISSELWRFDDVVDHWDELLIRCYAVNNNQRTLYQDGKVSDLRRPEELIKCYTNRDSLKPGSVMFCGTLAVIGEVQSAQRFELEIEDPVRNKSIHCNYDVQCLPGSK